MGENKRAWDSKLPLALWANRVTVKKAIGCAPFDLVYGIQARFPQNNLKEMYKFVKLFEDDIVDDMQIRMDDILQLEETKRNSSDQNVKMQLQMKHLYDKRATERKFNIGDLVLMWNVIMEDKGKHEKFDPIWLSPYSVLGLHGEDSYLLTNLAGDILEFPIHGQFLKRYFC